MSGFKDREAELAALHLQEADGWTVHHAKAQKVKRGPMWLTLSNDIWGAIDLAAMKATVGFRFTQVCTPDGVAAHRRKIEAVDAWPAVLPVLNPEHGSDVGVAVEIWEGREGRHPIDRRLWARGFRCHLFDPIAWGAQAAAWSIARYIEVPPKPRTVGGPAPLAAAGGGDDTRL